jgi:hypothetical protein
MSNEDRQLGQAFTIAAIYLFGLLSTFQIGVWKSLLFTMLVALCYVFEIGQRRLAQASVVMLFLTLAVSAGILPPPSHWAPAAQGQLAALKSAVAPTP